MIREMGKLTYEERFDELEMWIHKFGKEKDKRRPISSA